MFWLSGKRHRVWRLLHSHHKKFLWEPVKLDIWRGNTGLTKESHLVEYDADHYLVKEEMTHYGAKKIILKNKQSGKIIERTLES